jgi:hypothetical protein
MSESINNDGSAAAGSPIANGPVNPNAFGSSAGEPSKELIDKAQYEELESKMGEMGQELGDYRKFFEGISPLLDKLDSSPELVQAIVEGKITGELAKAALDGKVSVEDAAIVQQASDEVKKDLGTKKYSSASPDEVTKLIEERAALMKQELEEKFRAEKEIREFQDKTNDFINNTPDFADYAKEIDEWLDKHDVTDIKIAYYAVKGELSEREARKQAQISAGEAQKGVAANAAGGGTFGTAAVNSEELADQLIAGRSNPNVF